MEDPRSLTDIEFATEVRKRLDSGGDISSLLEGLGPTAPLEWRNAVVAFANIHAAILAFTAGFQKVSIEELNRNLRHETTRRDRPDRFWSASLPLLFLEGPAGLPALAARFYRSAIKWAEIEEAHGGLRDGLHKGVEYNNLAVALLRSGDWAVDVCCSGIYLDALDAVLRAAAEDRRFRPGEVSHAATKVLLGEILEPAEERLYACVRTVLPQLSSGSVDEAVLSKQDVMGFCGSLDDPNRLYLHLAVRRGLLPPSSADLAKLERLTAIRGLTLLFEACLRADLNMPSGELGSLLPSFAKKHGYSPEPWFVKVQAMTDYHGCSAQDADQRVARLIGETFGLPAVREQWLARSLLMTWLLRNFSSHQLEPTRVAFLDGSPPFAEALGYLLAALVILALMGKHVDFLAR